MAKTLDQQTIYAAALELIDREGTFSLAQLASHLGVRAPSLYTHVPNKEAIVEGVRHLVVAGIDHTPFALTPWPEALSAWARSYLAAFAAHPHAIRLPAAAPVRTGALLRQYEAAVGCLLRAGWPDHEVMHVITAVESYVLGAALSGAPAVPADGDYPLLTRVLTGPAVRVHDGFEAGLTALLAGFAQRLAALEGDP
ncbi:TetR/AcrR family transcriptional regulator C-terminal domain-containing protein [Paractinoplanes durhamensis]|uniref:TetR family transcriptional regulator n=1 Tax=Paractinoplanes durhamensis TaxID=113563 RepID=A0ABQ3YZU3_9ACTN|nr:TetR/AcrR family transcriptional regulator C-terminal domain-containing protein [Actinoplanes durhamensis]GIE03077.1 TetR family transcriptional regulator [Actinoplanes durhamensis]